ncbi:protein of unknown function [Maridesulfovibrio hydrothermalis AM13 = DSM 14728]|uniref:Uncharacterized protein n=1 Tax=Maridesulfovibrio hydrothermalis AM13 = DSM 14728 TaxID=1121451 RepID=L0R6N7_9BACT|nr:protein of unknown function [Maridesulfovibrio hydrothermalis AM13 = DSM 14728]
MNTCHKTFYTKYKNAADQLRSAAQINSKDTTTLPQQERMLQLKSL